MDLSAKYWNRGTRLPAARLQPAASLYWSLILLLWNQCWCFDFRSVLRPTRNKYLANARAPGSHRSSPHVWEALILWWSDELGTQPVPQCPGDAGMGQPSRIGSGCCWNGRSSACCTRQWCACSGNMKYNWKSKRVLKLQNTLLFQRHVMH